MWVMCMYGIGVVLSLVVLFVARVLTWLFQIHMCGP